MATVESKGPGLAAALSAAVAKLKAAREVKVGFLDGATYPDGTPVALVAAVQNYGGGAVPPRPFMDRAVQEHQGEWAGDLAKLLAQDLDTDKALRTMGQRIKEQVQQAILETNEPPLKPATIARKGFAKPLIDTSNMIDSVDYEVTR